MCLTMAGLHDQTSPLEEAGGYYLPPAVLLGHQTPMARWLHYKNDP